MRRRSEVRAPEDRPGAAADITPRDYETLAEFRYTIRRFLNLSAAAVQSAGLTPQQHQALLAIKGHPSSVMSIGELAARLLVRHHSTGELADRLALAGLIRRDADPADRRRSLLRLMPAAEALLAGLSQSHLDELRRIRPALLRLLRDVEARR